jgi:hypothetical protein
MRTPVIATSLTLLALSAPAAHAATAAPSGGPTAAASLPAGPPKVYEMAGYTQPDITPGLCTTVSPKETRTIPEMTAGRYLVQAAGTSTATGDGAVQAIDIRLDGGGDEQICAKYQSQTPQGGSPWTSGASTRWRRASRSCAACPIRWAG